MTKVAICARYSSDNQREASIEGQFRLCREYAKRQGWQLVESCSDQAISGGQPAAAGASRRSSRTRSPSGSTSSRRSRSIGSAATRRTSPRLSAHVRCDGHAADLLADDLTPSDRRPAQRGQAVAARCLPVPRLLPRRTHPGRSCCSRWSRSSAGYGGSGTRRYGR